MNRNPDGINVGITDEKAFSGSHSFKIQHISENIGYWFSLKTLFKNGTFEFSLMMFLNEESSYAVDFVVDWIIVKNGKITSGWDGGPIYDYYPINEWFRFGLKMNLIESNLNNEKRTFTMIVGNNETKFDLNRDDLRSIDFISMTSNGKGASYLDDIKAVTDQYVEPYFSDCFKIISDDNKNNDDNDNNKKGLGVGPIIGIVIAIVAIIVIIIIVIIIVRKKKAEQNTSTNENL